MSTTYAEKLKDQRWQKKRLELLEASGWKCQNKYCQNEKEKPTLHVHHKLYLRKTDPWGYEDWAYQVLCDECHESEQESMEIVHSLLAKHDDLLMALWWLSRTDKDTREAMASVLCGLFSLKPEYVKPLPSLLRQLCEFRMELISSGWHDGIKTQVESEQLKQSLAV